MNRWFADGLRFECTRCGNCCTGTPGHVWIDESDEQRIARQLGVTVAGFRKRYTCLAGVRLSLTERPGGDCVFLTEERLCRINPAKPRQCLTFPFWPRLMADPRNWEAAGRDCPGLGNGPLYEADEIDVLLDFSNSREVLCRILGKPRG